MASPSTGGSSLDVPLVNDFEDSNGDDNDTSGSATKKAAFLLLVVVGLAALMLNGCPHSKNQSTFDASFAEVHTLEDGGPKTYGMDVSWPIHGSISERNDFRRPEDRFAKNSRHDTYIKHLQGCRAHYGKFSKAAARTCDTYEFDRLLMNKRQPQSMENYTDVGFKKIRAPPRVAKIIQDFWEQNKDKQVPEVWPEGNIYLNHWESPSMMVSVDDTGLRGSGYHLKRNIWDSAQSTISQWAGGQDVTPVSMYGIRVYTNGSLLVPHVDRLPLVASAMINVAQEVEEDWPMEVYSHKTGMAHNVTLHPGDMLLFESHSVVHGRPFPLKGKFYAMIFIHFEPTGRTALKQRVGVDEQYRQAVQDGVGGQSSSEQSSLLPPYIRRFSPEEEHWQRENPGGWRSPAMSPASFELQPDDNGNSAAEEQQPKQPEEHQAARDGDIAYWEAALDKAANQYKLVNRRDAYGWQPIHESATNGREDLVDLLLRHGANINARTHGGRGGTPLFLAQHKLGSHHPIVSFLVDRGALSIPPDSFREEL
ncbi:Ankyrin Repeat [Seminavis robusta]|uniref:Ankyrin Repeat n=1 Tax=Seminavis robusta TaxID=568900 RepID=A0A9N8I0E7_9STRA|nr:Ankyrin Repeat [Seminavis robusta]|eukprot:Sro2660_g333970.1 Ankyrin Repeat (536) ;mRNA; f:9750-11449